MGPFWGPIPNDGVFFEGDPRENIYNQQVARNIPYFITTCSFEGSLLTPQMFPDGFSFKKLGESISFSNGFYDIEKDLPVLYFGCFDRA